MRPGSAAPGSADAPGNANAPGNGAPGNDAAQRRAQPAGVAAARAALADATSRPGGSRARNASALTEDPRLQTDADPPGPDGELTGTDLVMRELGGQVIEEISEA